LNNLELTVFGGGAFSPSFFIAGTDFSVSLLFSGAGVSDFDSVFAPTASSTSVSYNSRKYIND
jgi:hypothetical protein